MNNADLDWLAAQQPQRSGVDPGAHERALLALLDHTTSRPSRREARVRRTWRLNLFGAGAAVGVAAITAALALSALSSDGSRPLSHHTPAAVAATHRRGTHSPLVRLADYVSDSATPTGNATVVARTTTTGGATVTVYDLYADNGEYFFSQTASGLAGQVSAHNNLAGGLFAREIAAAKLAANGNVQTAAQDMADAPDPNHAINPNQPVNKAALQAKLKALHMPSDYQPGSTFDNWVWEDSQDALIAGSGQPQVRAGVLQILATLPDVTVTDGTSDGQPTLILTAGTAELGSGYTEQLTINADTGVPIQFIGGPTGGTPATTVDYKVSRATFAGLPTGSGTDA